MSVKYEKIVIEDSSEENNYSEKNDSDGINDMNTNANDSTYYIKMENPIAPAAVVKTPKRRGRPPKAESAKARLSGLHHTMDNSGGNDSNGISSASHAVPSVAPNVPKKRGRPPKSESEKNNRTKTPLRIALGPKSSKVRRVEPTVPSDEQSPFPLVQQTESVKKSRGRPRIRPPKDTSVKRPRGRPRLVPLEGEAALRAALLKLRREDMKKDLVIKKLTERLKELGEPVDVILSELSVQSPPNSLVKKDIKEEPSEDSECGMSATDEPRSMDDTHQRYIGMFAENEDGVKDETDSETE